MQTEHEVKTRINSEIHASLRRLEDADYAYNEMQDEAVNAVIEQANAANSSLQSQIDTLTNKFTQLYDDIAPHMYNNDLCYFQTAWIGNLNVASGGTLGGTFVFQGGTYTFDGAVTCESSLTTTGNIVCNGDEGVFAMCFLTGDGETYEPHSLTIEGVTAEESILASGDITFSLADLVEGVWAGGIYTVRTVENHTSILSTTLNVTVTPEYDYTNHYYRIDITIKDQNDNLAYTDSVVTGTTAFEEGEQSGAGSVTPESHTHRMTLSYAGTAQTGYLYQSNTDLGTGSHYVYY